MYRLYTKISLSNTQYIKTNHTQTYNKNIAHFWVSQNFSISNNVDKNEKPNLQFYIYNKQWQQDIYEDQSKTYFT